MTLLLALFEGARPPDQCEGTRSSCRCVCGGCAYHTQQPAEARAPQRAASTFSWVLWQLLQWLAGCRVQARTIGAAWKREGTTTRQAPLPRLATLNHLRAGQDAGVLSPTVIPQPSDSMLFYVAAASPTPLP
jgi:hypothetical protein